MSIHFTQTRERLVTHHANVFLSRRNSLVNIHMGSHIPTAGKSILAYGTLPFLFTRVRQHVFIQMWFGPGFVSANLALRVSNISLIKENVYRLLNRKGRDMNINLHAFVNASASMNDEWIVCHKDHIGRPGIMKTLHWAFWDKFVWKCYLFSCVNKHVLTQEWTSFHFLTTNHTFQWFSEIKIQFSDQTMRQWSCLKWSLVLGKRTNNRWLELKISIPGSM